MTAVGSGEERSAAHTMTILCIHKTDRIYADILGSAALELAEPRAHVETVPGTPYEVHLRGSVESVSAADRRSP